MGISDLVDDGVEVPTGKGSFRVRGLTLEDIASLLKDDYKEVVGLFEGKIAPEQLLTRFPALAAKVIAFAAGERDNTESVRKLSVGVQIKALQEIWRLTGVSADDLGKLARSLADGVEQINLGASRIGSKS